ncbi:long-subunit acyl-CoA synthetase (AMP-forming) [Catenuloplanes nepalensis]|uniref:Long-subunit acyl-CoA synthetase (AMP-forming) n=1 Tax=Catenuloplanes nepalensis TaxID=587533 RepID=A0ABT9N5T8_9ACTN|nr:AMP-binding protein [Catenuloplanes nepalensis]MDP9799039.1 long-subunit acyl-CoA synthetase (AMP-forming) [Catenuloplanes nepalensis]
MAVSAQRWPERALLCERTVAGWHELAPAELQTRIRTRAGGLLAAGLGAGDRIAILGAPGYEWAITDLAAWWIGAIPVALQEEAPGGQLDWMLRCCGASACVVTGDDPALTARVAAAGLAHAWQAGPDGPLTPLPALEVPTPGAIPPAAIPPAAMPSGAVATIVYTSGVSGRPAACRLTHANLDAAARAVRDALPQLFGGEPHTVLSALPLSHIFGRIVHLAALTGGARIAHTGPERILADLAELRPSVLAALPRFFELLWGRHLGGDGTAERAALAGTGGLRGWLRRSRHEKAFAVLRDALGGRMQFLITGGAPVSERLAMLYQGAGVPLLTGYGLTEATAAVTLNTPALHRPGTVGTPLPGVEVRVSPDGEVFVRGPAVFPGYDGPSEADRDAVVDASGWLHTGDLGALDDDGYLRIAGNVEDMITLQSGRRVAAVALEEAVRAHPLVAYCLAVGERRPYVAALVALEESAVRRTFPDADDLAGDPRVIEAIRVAIDAANARASAAEQIRRFEILPGGLSRWSGHLTPALRPRRRLLSALFAAEIERLYAVGTQPQVVLKDPVEAVTIEARAVAAKGPHGLLLRPTSVGVVAGRRVAVAGPPGHGHTALALALGGRLEPDDGEVTLDGERSGPRLREAVALVDVPGISEPDEMLPLAAVVGEELSMARARTGRRAVREWLDRHGALVYAETRAEHVPGAVRTRVLAELAALRPGVSVLVLTLPDRHGGGPSAWWDLAGVLAARGYGVLVQCTDTSAELLGLRAVRLGNADPDTPAAAGFTIGTIRRRESGGSAITEPIGRHTEEIS